MTESNPEIHSEGHSDNQLLEAMERVLTSQTFAEVFRLKKFLEYSVRETLAGRGDRLKGFVIACEVFGKDDPSDAQTTTVVRVEAGRLRRRLKDYYETEGKDDPIRISIPKGGYSASFTEAGTASPESSEPGPAPAVKPLHHSPVVWITVLALLAVFFFLPWMNRPEVTSDPATLPDTRPTIAVMPFENLAEESGGASFASGLTEDIVIDLGGMSALDVISVSSVLQYKGLQLTPREIGVQLGVRYVLEGSVRRLTPNLRVNAHLSDTQTGLQLWAERFESAAGDQLAVQEDLARKVVSSLSIRLPESGQDRFGYRYTQDKRAWFLFKQAMNLANPPSDPARLELALQAFEQVSEMDPEFAGGFAGMAYIKAFLVFFRHSEEPVSDRAAAKDMAARARQIDPAFGLTYSALAFIELTEREFEDALAMSSRAVEIQPSDPYITVYHGFILALNGDLEGGLTYANRALRLDPLYVRTPYLNIIGVLNYLAGHYDEAMKALLRNQERGGPLGPGQLQFLAATYSKLGDYAMAESTLRMSDGFKSGIGRSENWLLSAFRDPGVPRRLVDEVETIRLKAGNQ